MNCRVAVLSDLAALYPKLPRRVFARLAYQLGISAAVTIENDGAVLAVGGLYRQVDHFELWFLTSETLRGSRLAFRVVRIMHAALSAVPGNQPIVAYARGSGGARLCQLFGLTRDEGNRFVRHDLAGVGGALVSPRPNQNGV